MDAIRKVQTATSKEVTLIRRRLIHERCSFNCCEGGGEGCCDTLVEGVCDSHLYWCFSGQEKKSGNATVSRDERSQKRMSKASAEVDQLRVEATVKPELRQMQ